MRPTVALVLLAAAVLALALWALGVFRPDPSTPEDLPPSTPTNPPVEGAGREAAEPTEEPPLEPVPMPSRVRVLAIGNAPRSFPRWFVQIWESDARIEFQTWFAKSGTPGPHSASLEPLAAAPTAELLPEAQVLVLDDVDPAAFPEDFWRRVGERVRSGALGLWIHPANEHGHALATQSHLADVMPVVPKPVVGMPPGTAVAGVFDAERPLSVTPEGTKHLLTRLVRWPRWSATKWDALTKGPKPWGTKFVHPAEVDPKRNAAVLLTVRGHRDEPLPALVASDPARGRVLWVGLFDLGHAAYRDGSRSLEPLRALSLAWLAWLAGATA